MGRIIKDLNNQNIKLNITAVYTAKQTEKILSIINKNSKVIISILLKNSRCWQRPYTRIKKSIVQAKKFKNVEILWARVRALQFYASSAIRVAI